MNLLKWMFMSRFSSSSFSFFFFGGRGWEEQGTLSLISENIHSIEKNPLLHEF